MFYPNITRSINKYSKNQKENNENSSGKHEVSWFSHKINTFLFELIFILAKL